ncbi:hypothetical protein Acsp03_71410 [Actinomadura sp. NBRC 104412]|nr:hypothetical protein Acsp03_71410 [Actinomadura sp. NBRC 104412]
MRIQATHLFVQLCSHHKVNLRWLLKCTAEAIIRFAWLDRDVSEQGLELLKCYIKQSCQIRALPWLRFRFGSLPAYDR